MNEKTDTTRNVAARVGQEYEKILANKEQEIDKYKCELREQEKTLDSVNRAWIALTHDYNKLFSEFHDLKFESDRLKNENEATPNLWDRVTEQEKTIERLKVDLKLSELAVTTQMDRADRWGYENKAERERNEKLSIVMGIAQKEIIRLTERLKETEQLSGKRFHAIQELEKTIQELEKKLKAKEPYYFSITKEALDKVITEQLMKCDPFVQLTKERDDLLARALRAEESAKNWEIHAHWLEQGKGDWHDDPQQKEPKK